MILEKDLNIIKNIYDNNSIIKSVYLCGSSCLPWIQNPNDIDVIFVFDNSFFIKDGYPIVRNKKLSKNICCICEPEDYYENIHELRPYYAYLKSFNKHIYGKEYEYINFLQSKDIQENIKQYIKLFYNRLVNNKNFPKILYHIITSLFIIENKSYMLTSEQIDIINKIHLNPNGDAGKKMILYFYNKYFIKKEE